MYSFARSEQHELLIFLQHTVATRWNVLSVVMVMRAEYNVNQNKNHKRPTITQFDGFECTSSCGAHIHATQKSAKE